MNAREGVFGDSVDDWELLVRWLPPGWEEAARTSGALRRTRAFKDAATLLRCLLMHLGEGCSLAETAARAATLGWTNVSGVALFKRLRASEQWLRQLAEGLWRQSRPVLTTGRRVRAVDATVVCEAGQTGSVWRVHYSIDLSNLQCDFLELTTPKGGERLTRFSVAPGELIMGDRMYGRPTGVGYVCGGGADLLVRINLKNMPLFTAGGQRLNVLAKLRSLKVKQPREWAVTVRTPVGMIAGRFVALKSSASERMRVRRRLKKRAQRKQCVISKESMEAAGYVMIWTSLPPDDFPTAKVLEYYRLRWQIELAFKRMKSLLGLGQLPKRSDASSRAWLHGKLLVALLIERLIADAESFSPWGYRLEEPPQPLA
jgi:hypothetical protein